MTGALSVTDHSFAPTPQIRRGSAGFTTRIVQLTRDESASVLECLYRHIETPEFHCRFRWKPQSLEPRVRCVTAVDVLGQFDGLTNGTGGSMDALLGGRPPMGPYRNLG